MDLLKLYFKSLGKVIFASAVSLFIGLPILAYYLLNKFFEVLKYSLDGVALSIASMLLIIVFISLCHAVLTLYNEQKILKSSNEKIANDLKNDFDKQLNIEKELFDNKENQRILQWNEKYDYFKKVEDALILKESNLELMKAQINTIIDEKTQNYPWLSKLIADYMYLQDAKTVSRLKTKKRPAIRASIEVSDIAKEKRDLQKLCKMYEYQLHYLSNIFPWIDDFIEMNPTDAYDTSANVDEEFADEYDKVKAWLSPEEYKNLSPEQKWQRALDRYRTSDKTNWQIGRDYERYIGYLYENQGYKVYYQGAVEGWNDLGRDIVAEKDNSVSIIQCKYWSKVKKKVIHEKHVFQLYGTMIAYKINHPAASNIVGLLYTSTDLSETAKIYCDLLGIEYFDNCTMKDYPCIKCNISRRTGEKIYHLPFDQQYDKVYVESERGEVYARNINEAEKMGFRHAFKWIPDEQ